MNLHFKFSLVILLAASLASAQNWNVFNKNYRYNYKFDNSTIVTNVLFTDTITQSGSDTIYAMNKIGVECTSGCPSYSTSSGQRTVTVWSNMPQFLQRNIRKYSTGMVTLYDTTKIVIIPTCTLNQTWLFDSIYNKSAVCTNITLQTIFGSADSIRTILVNGVDTVKLSKNYGLIVFPQLYAKNKYYRLSGIESKTSYNQTALYGEKVPNAWDFYNYNVGDTFVTQTTSFGKVGGSTFNTYYNLNKSVIKNKTTLGTGYSYLSENTSKVFNYTGNSYFFNVSCNFFFPISGTITTVNTNTFYSNLNNPAYLENKMYPGMVVKTPVQSDSIVGGMVLKNTFQLVKFGIDNIGTFYKYLGTSCPSYSFQTMPNTNAYNSLDTLFGNLTNGNSPPFFKLCFGVGLGRVNENHFVFESGSDYYINSAVKGGTVYFGQPINVGLEENNLQWGIVTIFPNPANNFIKVNVDKLSELKIFNVMGDEVLSSQISPTEAISTTFLPSGVYVICIKNESLLTTHKLIIQH